MIVVSNTSPIINLASIGQLELLKTLYSNIIIPQAVRDEIVAGAGQPGAKEAQTLGWIATHQVTNQPLVTALQADLDRGEAEAIALAIEIRAELLLLDEPVNGLDPNGIIDIRKLLIKLNQEKGVTIFVSSHLLSEIEKMCTHVGIISKGKLRFEGTMQELSKAAGLCKIQVTLDDASKWQSELENQYENVNLVAQNQLTLDIGNKDNIPDFIKNLIAKNAAVYEVKILDGLEEWFMTITNENRTDEK